MNQKIHLTAGLMSLLAFLGGAPLLLIAANNLQIPLEGPVIFGLVLADALYARAVGTAVGETLHLARPYIIEGEVSFGEIASQISKRLVLGHLLVSLIIGAMSWFSWRAPSGGLAVGCALGSGFVFLEYTALVGKILRGIGRRLEDKVIATMVASRQHKAKAKNADDESSGRTMRTQTPVEEPQPDERATLKSKRH